ncbi:MFS transporter [Pseudonocardia aurantiaca]
MPQDDASNPEPAASPAATGPASPAEWQPDPKRWRALAVTQIAAFMSLLDVSIVNVALPSIERGLGASAASVQWVVSGYALTLGLVLVAAGRLGDTLGRRRMFLIALSAFVVTSALTGAAPTMQLLIVARLLQGIAGGMLIPQNSGLVQDLFRGPERGRAFGILGATIGLSTAAGPIIGGLILSAFPGPDGWRWVFYVNVPIGLVGLLLASRLVPATTRAARRAAHLDLVGALLLGGGVLSLLFPLVSADTGDLARGWPLFVVAMLLFAAFAWWEGRTVAKGRAPLLEPRLARTSGFPAGSGIGLLYYIGFAGIWLVLALYFQAGLGYSPLRSGLSVTPFALGVAASAAIAGRLVPRFGRRLTVFGLGATIVGLAATAIVLLHVQGDAAGWAVAAPLLLGGLGAGMVTSPNMTLTLQEVPVSMAGAAGGALQTAQRIGSAIGTAVLAAVFYQVLSGTGFDYQAAASDALLFACAFMVLALLMAVAELVLRRPRHLKQPALGQAHMHHV